ncbi:MAG: DUF4258 domain-containing protein [Chloroflexota bacterium]|nr:DUF4258 domain-containing protein [Chloroflexota bacterium]
MKIIFRIHAIQRMFARGVTDADVRYVLVNGETIEDYPDDMPYPSRLVLGWCGIRPLHIVVADNFEDGVWIIVTVYEPDPNQWEADFRRRKL